MAPIIMAFMFVAGAAASFLARTRLGPTAGRLALGVPVIATGVAFVAFGLIGGAAQQTFTGLMPLWISPAILGLVLGFVLARGRGAI